MSRLLSATLATILTVAVGSVPLLADWCAIACEAPAQAAGHAADPSCHHGAFAGLRIGHAPQPCSHEHRPSVVETPSNGPQQPRVAGPVLATTHDSAFAVVSRAATITGSGSALGPSSGLALALSSALRI